MSNIGSSGEPGRPRVIRGSDYLRTNPQSDRSSYRRGREGEEIVLEVIYRELDDRWTIFTNVYLPDGVGDIDIVLVGPPGIWAVEVKAYTPEYMVVGSEWRAHTRDGNWVDALRNPSEQAQVNAHRLHGFLEDQGLGRTLAVWAVVAMAGDSIVEVQRPDVQVWLRSELNDRLQQIKAQNPQADLDTQKIVAALSSIQSREGRGPVRGGYAGNYREIEPITPSANRTTNMGGASYTPRQSAHKQQGRRGSRSKAVWALVEIVGTLIAATLLWQFFISVLKGPGESDPSTVIETRTSTVTGSGSVQPITDGGDLKPTRITASASAPDGKDSKGNIISFAPSKVLDGDASTAWRVPGSGVGQFLLLEFEKPVRVGAVGLLPGYAKIDPYDKTNRFYQNRRVQKVRYEFDGGSSIEQTFVEQPTVQWLKVDAVTTRLIRVVIEQSSAPGAVDGRDFTAISEVVVEGQQP